MTANKEESLLSRLHIASPCDADWDAMKGNDRVRACGDCKKNVYNISDMTKAEAEAFLRRNGTKECTRFYRRKDGTILTDDCPIGLRKLRDAWRKASKVASLIIGTVTFCSAASSQNTEKFRQKVVFGIPVQITPIINSISLTRLCTGKFKLKTPEQVFEVKSKILVCEGKGSTEVFELPNTFTLAQATIRAVTFEQMEKFNVAELYYKLALNLGSDRLDEVERTKALYSKLLRRLERDKEATELEQNLYK